MSWHTLNNVCMTRKNKKHTDISYCRFCKKDLTYKPSNRRSFCDVDCFSKWVKLTGSKRKRIVCECKRCKKPFESKPAEKRVFCSKVCLNEWNREDKKNSHFSHSKETREKISRALKGKFVGRNSTFSKSGKKILPMVEKTCPVCQKVFMTPNWKNKKFCSDYCSRRRPGQGGYRAGSVTNFQSGWYESPMAGRVWLDSSYEFIMAKYLDEKKYKWSKNKTGFDYPWIDGKMHLYFPDFYIQDLDIWVETKGYMVERDTWKWYFFPHELRVVTKKKIFNPEYWGF